MTMGPSSPRRCPDQSCTQLRFFPVSLGPRSISITCWIVPNVGLPPAFDLPCYGVARRRAASGRSLALTMPLGRGWIVVPEPSRSATLQNTSSTAFIPAGSAASRRLSGGSRPPTDQPLADPCRTRRSCTRRGCTDRMSVLQMPPHASDTTRICRMQTRTTSRQGRNRVCRRCRISTSRC
jgi:hypothetical protein